MKINLCFIVSFALLLLSSSPVLAGILDCTGCHAKTGTGDLRPLDSSFRNITSGAFQGNHQTHMSLGASPDTCSECHNNAGFTSNHRDRKVQTASKIGNYSSSLGRARYATTRATTIVNGSVFFNQTSVPVLASCSNVNCHFETITPMWGANPALTTCGTCHGAPPGDGSHPAIYGPGKKHGDYYGTTTASCVKCHSDHVAEPSPFAHATSAGNRGLVISFAAAPNNGSGSYSGVTTYPNYLPSNLPARNGSCSNTYCHSPGNKATILDAPNKIATWGGSLSCNGCHKADAVIYNDDIATGSHSKHVNGWGLWYTTIKCVTCHQSTTNGVMAITDTSRHVNKKVEVAFDNSSSAVNGSYNGQLAKPGSPSIKDAGTAFGSCANVYCHSTGQGAGGSWPPTYQSPTWGAGASGRCGTCHGVDSNQHSTMAVNNVIASGSHSKHVSYTFGITDAEARCAACHSTSPGLGQIGCQSAVCHTNMASKHANYEVNVGIPALFGATATYNGTTKPGDGYGSCANVYCHSNGTRKDPPYVSNSFNPSWGNASSVVCGSCHKATSGTGFPVISSAGHTAHLTSSVGPKLGTVVTACQVCHPYSTTTHVNKAVEKNPCTPCHTGTEPTWQSKQLACEDCHGKNATVSVMNNMSAPNKWIYYTAPRGISGGGGHGSACNNCHGNHTPPYTFDNGQHISGVRGDWQGLNRTLDGTAPYLMNPATWVNSLPDNNNCDSCHSAGSLGQKMTHVRSTGEGSNASMSCVACHDTHGAGNLHMIRSKIWYSPSQAPVVIGFTNISTYVQYQAPYQGLCQVCHTLTGHFKRGVAEPSGAGQHGSPAYRKCTSCHDHGTKLGTADFKVSYAFQPAGCDGCHGYPPVNNMSLYGKQNMYTSAKLQNYSGGGGAHTATGHLAATVKATDGNPWQACQLCHDGGEAAHTKNITAFSTANSTQQRKSNVSVKVKSRNRLSNNRLPSYQPKAGDNLSNTASCWNVNCHFQPTPRWGADK